MGDGILRQREMGRWLKQQGEYNRKQAQGSHGYI
jgi:hypothetical protein